jgi:hypothetical protein
MATLTINFTPVPGIASYNVCYKPVGAPSFVCIEESSSPVVVNNVDCGVDYEISVTTNCPPGEFLSTESVPVTATVTGIPCPPPVSCISYTLATSATNAQNCEYLDCLGNPQSVQIGGVNGYDATTICAIEGSVSAGGEVQVVQNGPCEEPKTVNVQSVSGYMQPCIGGTIDDYMGAGMTLDTSVTVETNFTVEVYWSQKGAGCTFPYTQSFGITVRAGENYGDIDPCLRGAYFPSGADICGAAVTGHDNTVDNIIL